MDIAMIGLGKMGANMTTRLLGKGHRVVVYDVKEAAVRAAETGGATGARTLDDVVGKLSVPRAVWVMVPSGNRPTTPSRRWRAGREEPDRAVPRSHRVPRQEAGRKAHGGTPLLPRRS